jgi:hypothetical protein
LIHSKKAISNQETALFKAELEKFRPMQVRLLQANHKQSSVFKDLTRTYSELLQDKRVKSERNKYEVYSRQRGSVMSRYRKVHQAFTDLQEGLERARKFYTDMQSTIDSQAMNVESFVGNRKSEGGELLAQIERKKTSGSNGQGNADTERLQALMGRMNVNGPAAATSPKPDLSHRVAPMPPQTYPSMSGTGYAGMSSPPTAQSSAYSAAPTPRPYQQQPPVPPTGYSNGFPPRPATQTPYNPGNYGPMSPPAPQYPQHPGNGYTSPPQHNAYVPPPPPGPPPNQHGYGMPPNAQYSQQQQQQQQSADPWAGLSGWK